MERNKALDHYRVLELSHYIAGPLCGQILADFGADVLKIEPPTGDPSRKAFPVKNDASAYFAAMNRGKKFRTLDLKNPEGVDEFYELVRDADAVVTNYAHGVPERLGIDFAKLQKVNPALVYTQVTGFGSHLGAPSKPAYDGVIQAMSGIAHLTGEEEGPPLKTGLFVADHLSAWVAATGTLIALQNAVKTKEAQLVDISMLDSMFSVNQFNVSLVTDFGKQPMRAGNRSTNVLCTTYETKDGWVYIAPITDRMWKALSELIGRPEFAAAESGYLTNDSRLANFDFLEHEINGWTSKLTTMVVSDLLTKAGVAFGVVQDLEAVIHSELIKEREMIINTALDGQEFSVVGNPIKIRNNV